MYPEESGVLAIIDGSACHVFALRDRSLSAAYNHKHVIDDRPLSDRNVRDLLSGPRSRGKLAQELIGPAGSRSADTAGARGWSGHIHGMPRPALPFFDETCYCEK